MKKIRLRLTYGNVVATLALFIAIGGASAFAASQLRRNSVGSRQLKAKSVTTVKIKPNAVTASKIADNAVTTPKLADSTVTGQKIADNAITTPKLMDSAVTGQKINLATLGTVPSADRATTVDGQAIDSFSVTLAENGPSATALAFGGVSLTASCKAPKPTLVATPTAATPAVAQFFGVTTDGESKPFGGEQKIFSTLLLQTGTFGAGTLDVYFSDGKVTTIDYSYRADTFSGAPGCRVFGKATTG